MPLRGKAQLFSYAELLNDGAIPLDVSLRQVVQEAAAFPYELEQPTTRRVVFCVRLQVLGQVANAMAKDRNLHFGPSGIGGRVAETLDKVLFLFFRNHVCYPLLDRIDAKAETRRTA